ncbi:MAG: hypothetical protein A2Y17_00805 [Clostridiales bacterium GWF2_38_85]|nr:MAG: hypothetical protein A2Y17_00805 [Clostridiales bacterium GWF2_38_85]
MGILNGVLKIFQLIYEEGEKEWLDETKYKEALNELYIKLESGRISEDEYEKNEEKILEQLRTVRKYKKEHGYTND